MWGVKLETKGEHQWPLPLFGDELSCVHFHSSMFGDRMHIDHTWEHVW
jgi:hypothetical protein